MHPPGSHLSKWYFHESRGAILLILLVRTQMTIWQLRVHRLSEHENAWCNEKVSLEFSQVVQA